MESSLSASGNASLISPVVQDSVGMATGVLSDKALDIGMFVNHGILTPFLVIFGTIANIINAIVYFKIGFKESINISLWVLAISDLGSCFSLITFIVCYNPLVRNLDLPFDPDQINYAPATIHIAFTRITSIITTLITVERCLCVVAPLKVKQIITPKRVSVFLACVIFVVAAIIIPHAFTTRYEFQFVPERNKTVIVVRFIEGRQYIDDILFTLHSILIPFPTLIIIVIATIFLVVTLRQKTKWRKNTTSSANSNNLSTRDAKISQMVILIAAVFIAASLPVTISYTITLLEQEYYLQGRYHNLYTFVYSFHFNLEAFNSCFNIFIYYRMSSAYKTIFLRLFGKGNE